MPKPLHPNLARLAASYDEIFERWSTGSIGATQARGEIAALVARDDDGTLWTLDPDSGAWLRRTRSGELVADEPPTYGLATPTPHDVSTGNSFNPDSRLQVTKVGDELLYSPSQFAGSTRAPRQAVAVPTVGRGWMVKVVLGVLLAVGVLAGGIWWAGGHGHTPAPAAPTTTVPVPPPGT